MNKMVHPRATVGGRPGFYQEAVAWGSASTHFAQVIEEPEVAGAVLVGGWIDVPSCSSSHRRRWLNDAGAVVT